MAIDRLVICRWSGNTKEDQIVQNPTWFDVENAVKRLNGKEYNDIYLTPDIGNEETYLAIGGGDGQYLVAGSINNEIFPTYVDAEKSVEKQVQIVVGGQLGDYPENYIVSLDAALKAVKSFYETGNFGNDVPWQNL